MGQRLHAGGGVKQFWGRLEGGFQARQEWSGGTGLRQEPFIRLQQIQEAGGA